MEAFWPRPDDKLFTDDGGMLNACVGWPDDQWHGYIEGFRRGAHLLVLRVAESESDQDYLVYPIVFGYRQALEVALKHLLFKGSQFIERESGQAKGHSLLKLWGRCRPMIEEVWPDGATADLDAVGDVLTQFEAKDPSSTTFRYPTSLDGLPSLPGGERINLLNFAQVAERAFSLIDACRFEFCRILDDLRAMEADYSY